MMKFALAFALTAASGFAIDLSATTDAAATATADWDCTTWHTLTCTDPSSYKLSHFNAWREACPGEWVRN